MTLDIKVGETSASYISLKVATVALVIPALETLVHPARHFTGGHALRIQVMNILIHGGLTSLVFLDQLGLNAAVTVTRAIDIELTVFGDQGLAVTIIAAEVIKVLLCFHPPGGCKGSAFTSFLFISLISSS